MTKHPIWTIDRIGDQTGRRAIVTGGNGGIGFAAASVLAARGMHVTITSRDAGRGAAAVAAIRAQAPAAHIDCGALDLADLASVRRFAAEAGTAPLDLLLNNAGVMAVPKREATVDGFERQFGTNHLGHFALTGLLLPSLLAASQGRVVTVSSIAHRRGEMRFSDLQSDHGYVPWTAYSQSKLANLLFALELQRRLSRTGASVISVAAHPGVAATNLASTIQQGGGITGALTGIAIRIFGQSAAAGALPLLMASTAPDMAGAYIGPNGMGEMRGTPAPAVSAPPALDTAAAGELWRRSETLTGVSYLSA